MSKIVELYGWPSVLYIPFLESGIRVQLWEKTSYTTARGLCGLSMEFVLWANGCRGDTVCMESQNTAVIFEGMLVGMAKSGRINLNNYVGKKPQCPECLATIGETVFEYLKGGDAC